MIDVTQGATYAAMIPPNLWRYLFPPEVYPFFYRVEAGSIFGDWLPMQGAWMDHWTLWLVIAFYMVRSLLNLALDQKKIRP